MNRGILPTLLAAWLVFAGAAWAGQPPARSVVVLQAMELLSDSGRSLGRLEPGMCLDLVSLGQKRALVVETGPGGEPKPGRALSKPRRWQSTWMVLFEPDQGPGPWWVTKDQVKSEGDIEPGAAATVSLRRMGYLDLAKAAVLPGPAAAHKWRLAAIAGASLEPAVARRLTKGIIAKGDFLWHVEMAWGKPQRSFMVNPAFDEQHFIYLGRTPRPIILRFKGGMLSPPLPSQKAQ